ncbi:MAG: hypothetical protein R3C17_02005 [Planctomycetaceae bacterium]
MGKRARPGQKKPSSRSKPSALRSSAEHLRRKALELLTQQQFPLALEALDTLIESGQACVDDYCLAGKTLLSMREFAQAAMALEDGLRLDREHEESRFSLAATLFQLGDVSAAVRHFQWVADRYNNPEARLNLATIAPGCPEIDHQQLLEIRRTFARSLQADADTTPILRVRSADGRLRVGYISAFFHRSNYMKPVWGLINGHDRSQFEIHLFADDTDEQGLAWFKSGSRDQIHLTQAMSNRELATLIRQQQLDILIDLNGYSAASRLEIFMSRLAPVTVTWFNMYATSGLAGIDWIIGDDFVIRPEEEQFYSEKICRLPQSYLSFVVGHHAPDVVPPPCLGTRKLTFGSLVSQYKITPVVLDVWSEILKRCPDSRLILGNRSLAKTANRDYVERQFQRRGVEQGRVQLLPPADHFEFLKYYDRIDIALDSFPYNGGTTTTEAIWQGVPVLAFDGDRWASRTSRTLLMNCHLNEFVASSAADYIDQAVHWATNPDSPQYLSRLRAEMRSLLLKAPVCQIDTMVKSMEATYLQLFEAVAKTP